MPHNSRVAIGLDAAAAVAGQPDLATLHEGLKEKVALLQTTLGSIAQGVLLIGADGRVVTHNSKVCELLNFPEWLLDGHPTLRELTLFQMTRGDFGPDIHLVEPAARCFIEAFGSGGVPGNDARTLMTGPANYLRKTVAGRILEVKTQTLPSGGIVRTFADVSDHIQAEEASARLHLLLEATQSMARVGGWEVDVVRNRVTWTDEVYRILDTSPQEYTPETATTISFFTPSSAKKVRAAIDNAMANATPHDLELEMVTAKGRRIWVHSKSTLTVEMGHTVKRFSVLQDITERKQTEMALRASEEHFRQITSQMPGVVYRVHISPEGLRRYSFVSPGVRDLYGVEPAAVMADGALLHTFRHPEDQAAVAQQLDAAIRNGRPVSLEFRVVLRDGTQKWVQLTSSAAYEDVTGTVRNGVMLDITARKQAEAGLREAEVRWKLALDSTGDGVWDWNLQTRVGVYSRRCIEMYGYEEGELEEPAWELVARIHPDDLEQRNRDLRKHVGGLTPTFTNEHRRQCKDGSWKWILSRGMVISRDEHGKALRVIGTHTDITGRKQSETLIWQQANFDALTGLPNRRMLRDRLEQDIKKSRREGLQLAILFIDLDHFKEVNDTLGHDIGDLLLVEAARRIRDCVRESDTVARMGGDEFTVVLPELNDSGDKERMVQSILEAITAVFMLGDERVFVTASIGITVYPEDAIEVENLFKNADQALYVAKGAGRNRFSFFTPAQQESAQTRVRLTNDLRAGLAQDQFLMVYQPIVSLGTGAIHKAEALIRWQHPTRGLVSPAAFIPVAEASGLITDIGNWVFKQVANQAKNWRGALHPNFQISLNKSPVQFRHDGPTDAPWVGYLNALGLPGDALAVEITEGLLLDAVPEVTQKLLKLRNAGIQVSLDDFGTGYSSLSYLQKFEIDYIKIDQSFVCGLTPGSTDMALCKAIIVMAHELGIKVIAEGIETISQRDLLTAAGCDFGQGYLFGRPMTTGDFENFFTQHKLAAA